MRLRSSLVALALGAVSAGCGTMWTDIVRNATEAPVQGVDDCYSKSRDRWLAREAWRRVEASHRDSVYSPDFADGFQDGFAEYLYEGGNGQPPAVPPFRYRLSRYQTPEGQQAILEWYDGYREGAAAGRASGLREVMVIPLAEPPINAVPDRPTSQAARRGDGAAPPEPAPELPPPRSLVPAAPEPPPG
jgi:hypothetical protein